MNDNTELVNSLAKHIASNAECQRCFMLIVAKALPHLDSEIAQLMGEWHRVNEEINKELETLTQK